MNYIDAFSYKITPGRDNFNIKICPECNQQFTRFYYNESITNPKNMFFRRIKTICVNKHEIDNTEEVKWTS